MHTTARRALAAATLLALITACGLAAPEDTEVVAPAPAPVEVVAPEAPAPMPTLDPNPTGVRSDDPNVTIDRCVATGWSYAACDTMFPTQGRQYVAWACQSGPAPDRPILCARWAQYRIVGVGGPVEREAGLATLRQQCDQSHRISCGDLAEHLLFDDLAGARAATRTACDEDPRSSPVGLCETLHAVLADDAVRRTATVTRVSGLAGVTEGGQCRVWVTPNGADSCQGYVECGRHVLWGRGGSYFPCTFVGGDVRGGEAMVTEEDGDGAFQIDTAARTLTVRDDASGPLGAFDVAARLDE